MWEKIKESKFGKACRSFSQKKGAVATVVCLVMALAIVMTASIATNRAKKNQGVGDEIGTTQNSVTTEERTEAITSPTYNDGGSENVGGNGGNNDGNGSSDVGGNGGDEGGFLLSLPVEAGKLAKGHDATLQVWSDTMGDYRVHLGVDIATVENAPVFAAAAGTVERIWDDALMGKCLAISHDGGEIYTIYKNLSANLADGIEKGSAVSVGQKIGYVGSTAISELADEPHVHLEMTVGGLNVNPWEYFDDSSKDMMGNKTDNSGK